MNDAPVEFSRLVRFDEMGRMKWPARIEADASEREALALRFGFAALDMLQADYSLHKQESEIVATGEIRARLSQPCIATGEPVAEEVRESFSIRFIPEEEANAFNPDEEIELDAGKCDIIAYTGERIDIGEAVAETLALVVDPYPRSPQADLFLKQAGVLSEDQAGPFAALAALKGKSEKRE